MQRALVRDAGAGNRTAEGDALSAELAPHKERQEREIEEALATGIGLGQFHAPRRTVDRSGTGGGEFKTEAGAIEAPPVEAPERPVYSRAELLRLRAAGIAPTEQASDFLDAESQRDEERAAQLEAERERIIASAEEIALAYETAYQRHLHRHRHREHNRREDATADACCCGAEANADSREGAGGKGDEPDANEACETVKLTLTTPASPAGAASAALAPRAGGRPPPPASGFVYVVEKSSRRNCSTRRSSHSPSDGGTVDIRAPGGPEILWRTPSGW